MSGDPARAALDARVLEWMSERQPEPDGGRFRKLALDLFAFQFERCPPYARFCAKRGRTPTKVTSWREIPAVPTGAFKELALRGFAEERVVKTFRTSGTSGRRRGELHLDTLAVYEASLLWSFRRHVLPDLKASGERMPLRVLAPSPSEASDSSLSHMFACVTKHLGAPGSGFDVKNGSLCFEGLFRAFERAVSDSNPLALCGTAFAFVHLVDELGRRGWRIQLPTGTRVMETGGFKGRSRSVPRAELYGALEEHLGVPPSRIVNQYGMTELGSQFYDSVLCEPEAPRRKCAPPWVRIRVVDPTTGQEVRSGEVGLLVIFDLANTGSVLALQTADLGHERGDGFEVLGRETDAEARGCSIALDEMLTQAKA
jgi:hypothetical protein